MSRLSKNAVAELIKSKPLLRDDLKLSDTDSGVYYQLSDGRILIFFRDSEQGVLFESEEQFKKAVKSILSQKSGHVLEGVFVDESDFYKSVVQAPSRLGVILAIPVLELDRSYSSLKKIDRQIGKESITFDFYIKNIYKYLFCYVGEVIVKNNHGKWEFVLDGDILEPHVVLANGRSINIFIDLFDEAQEDWENFSVYDTAQLRLENPLNL